MFCDGCGTAIQPGQAFCSRCGKQFVLGLVTMPRRAGRVEGHLRFLGILWMAFSAFNTIGGVALYVVANTIFAHPHELGGPEGAPAFLRPLLTIISYVLFAKAALGFFAGWGLLQRDSWGRGLALVLAFVTMITNIPFGTALGIYTLWVLLPLESEQEYDAIVAKRAA